MWSLTFWRSAAERAVKTAAQTLIAMLGASAVDVLSVDWVSAASVAAGAALLSVLMSLGSARSARGGTGSPGLVG